jgi:hypothetical protein
MRHLCWRRQRASRVSAEPSEAKRRQVTKSGAQRVFLLELCLIAHHIGRLERGDQLSSNHPTPREAAFGRFLLEDDYAGRFHPEIISVRLE